MESASDTPAGEEASNDITEYIENGLPSVEDEAEQPLCLTFYTGSLPGYSNRNCVVDFTKEYTFRFTHKEMPDVRSEFIIHNKRFVCKELEYVLDINGVHPLISGTFYAVRDRTAVYVMI